MGLVSVTRIGAARRRIRRSANARAGGGGDADYGREVGRGRGMVSPCARLQMELGAEHDEKCGRETEAEAWAAPWMSR
jgi:hypothetical protein